MNRTFSLAPLILAAAALMALGLLAGCSSEDSNLTATTAAGDNFDQMDFSRTYGGLTATDEYVAFGDEGLKAMLLAEDQEAVDDPLATDPEVLEMEEQSRNQERRQHRKLPDFTYLRLRWGMLRGPDDTTAVDRPCDVTDWSGTFRIDRGVVVVKRMIRFEYPQDHVVFPHLDRHTVAFVSKTRCGLDGLVIQIIEPALKDTTEVIPPNKLYIDTPSYKAEFLVSDLADMDEVFEVDDVGNKFQITGFTLQDIELCPKGFLSGRYRHARPDTTIGSEQGQRLGSYSGAWVKLDGRIHGFLRGGYGIDEEGQRIFVGKFIDRQGRFKGLIRGGWEPAGDEGDFGEFRGQWVNRNGQAEGLLRGKAHPVEGYPGGFFEGRWTTLCDEEAEDLVQ